MATALVTTAQVTARMSATVTDTDRLNALIADVSAALRAITGQTITQATTTDRLRVHNGRVTLPQRPATAVTAVTDLAGASLTFAWDGLQRIDVPATGETSFDRHGHYGPVAVDVTYTHGHAPGDVLDAVAGICAGIVARAYGTPPEHGGVSSEQIDDYQRSYGTIGAAGAWGVMPDELAVLRKIVGGPRKAGQVSTEPLRTLP